MLGTSVSWKADWTITLGFSDGFLAIKDGSTASKTSWNRAIVMLYLTVSLYLATFSGVQLFSGIPKAPHRSPMISGFVASFRMDE